MARVFSFLFVVGLFAGFVFGWINDATGFKLLVHTIVGGFFGSCVIAVLFTYLYFTHEETDKEKH